VTRRLSLEWPDPTPFGRRDGTPIRILAVSDMLEPTLGETRNREAMGPIDVILGCGDLDCDDLRFVADRFDAPLVYVMGNHDSDEKWARCGDLCPEPMHSETVALRAGVAIAGLTWPGSRGKRAIRSESTAWRQSIRLAARCMRQSHPLIVISHVPPVGVGDVATDPYHRGFKGYGWLLHHLQPALWLHGHTPLAAAGSWHQTAGSTRVVNVTGAVLIELLPPVRG
jgi:Icc-related predicted phosphoesterase